MNPNKFIQWIIAIAAMIIITGILVYAVYTIHTFRVMNAQTDSELAQIDTRDFASLLAGCRQLIGQYHTLQNDWSNRPMFEDDRVLDPEITDFSTNVPTAIRDLKPAHVIVRTNYALVRLNTPFVRASYLGFAENADEFGTRRLIPGLWFWTGESRSNYSANKGLLRTGDPRTARQSAEP